MQSHRVQKNIHYALAGYTSVQKKKVNPQNKFVHVGKMVDLGGKVI